MNSATFNFLKYLSLSLAALAIVWFGYSWFTGDELTLPWQVESTFKTRPFLIEYFQINGKPGGVVADQIISWQKFRTGKLQYLVWPENLLLLTIGTVLIIGTLAITYLDRFSYFIFAGIVIFCFIQLRLEELGVADPYLTYGLIGGFLLLTYFFQAFKKTASVFVRLISILILYGIFFFLINYLPNMDYPYQVVLSFGIMGPLLWATLFIIFIAGDNVYSLFKLTTQGETQGKNGLIHFGVIGIIYVLLVALMFMEKNGDIRLNLFLIEPETILIASMISGYFSFDNKIKTINVSGDTFVLKDWLYPVLCTMTLAVIAYAKITANDGLENAIDWVILISHLAFGAAFFIYALINFIPALLDNLQVWPIFFQGPRTPMLTVRLFCIIMVVGGFLYLEFRPYRMAKSGQYTMLASLAEHIDNQLLADQYHKQSNFNEFYNFRSNYALAQKAKTEKEREEIPDRLIAILRGGENPKARVAISNYYAEREDLYRTLSTLMYSPESQYNDQVQNNLGLAHYGYQNYDSAYLYFTQSLGGGAFVSEGNLAALNYEMAAKVNFDTTINYEYENNIHLKLNRQALANAQSQYLPFSIELNPDTLLTREQLFYIYNASLSRKREDWQKVEEALSYYQSSFKNNQYNTFMLTAKAFLYYNSGQVNNAFRTLESVIASNIGASGFPYYVKAIWAFDQGQSDLTVESVNNSRKRGYDEAPLLTFMEDLKTVSEYNRTADISAQLSDLQSQRASLNKDDFTKGLVQIAQTNAFDVSNTLKAIDLLKQNEAENELVYNLLREALEVNDRSAELWEAYIYACAQNNLRVFGETALEKIENLVDVEQMKMIKTEFERILQEKRQLQIQ